MPPAPVEAAPTGAVPADLTMDMSQDEFDEHMNQKAELEAGILLRRERP
jgi:hypothetical protein